MEPDTILSTPNPAPAPTNDVWGTLLQLGTQAITYKRDVALAKLRPSEIKSSAAPSGKPGFWDWNPFPGTQGPYPQAEGKPKFAAESTAFNPMMLLIIGGALLFFMLLRR